jgi:hypothetical protein
MTLTVFVEPGPAGFRATVGGPPAVTADGPTADEAVEAARAAYQTRLAAGEVRVIHVAEVAEITRLAAKIGENPLFEEYEAAVQEFRREFNKVPDDE